MADADNNRSDEAEVEVEVDHEEVVQYDEGYDKEKIANLAKAAPRTMFRHPSTFTPDEDKLIAAEIYNRKPLYRIAAILHCSYKHLKKHIDNTPELVDMVEDAREREKIDIEQGLDELVNMRHPAVLMWKAEKLIPEKYGKEAKVQEEDDTRIVIGAIPEEDLLEADKILEEAAEKPPEAGLTAMLDSRVKQEIDKSVGAAEDDGYDEDTGSLDGTNVSVKKMPIVVSHSEPILASSVKPNAPKADAPQQTPVLETPREAPSFGSMSDYAGGFGDDSFDSGDWMS